MNGDDDTTGVRAAGAAEGGMNAWAQRAPMPDREAELRRTVSDMAGALSDVLDDASVLLENHAALVAVVIDEHENSEHPDLRLSALLDTLERQTAEIDAKIQDATKRALAIRTSAKRKPRGSRASEAWLRRQLDGLGGGGREGA